MLRVIPLAISLAAAAPSHAAGPPARSEFIFEGRRVLMDNPDAAARGRPVLLVLHGGGGDAGRMARLGFDRWASRLDFAVVYPEAGRPGQRTQWADGRMARIPGRGAGADDVGYLRRLMRDIQMSAAARGHQGGDFHVVGASNGGMMAYRMACEASDVIGGAVAVIANMPEPLLASCRPALPLRFLAINGDADGLVPIGGGEVCPSGVPGCLGGRVASMEAGLAAVGRRAGCRDAAPPSALPAPFPSDPPVHLRVLRGCELPVAGIVVRGVGHVWPPFPPGPLGAAGGGGTTRNIDATEVAVRFLLQGKLPGER